MFVRACVRARARACVRGCMCVCVCMCVGMCLGVFVCPRVYVYCMCVRVCVCSMCEYVYVRACVRVRMGACVPYCNLCALK